MDPIEPEGLLAALKATRKALATQLQPELAAAHDALAPPEGVPFSIDADAVGKRRLRNVCLGYLAKTREEGTTGLCMQQFWEAESMTDSIAALAALSTIDGPERDAAMSTFYERAKANNEALVINKWFGVQAMADTPTVLTDVKALMEHEAFDATNPNRFRSLINGFAANPAAFHAADGSGYKFIADQVIETDKRNPQVAARLASSFNTWKRHNAGRQALMKAEIERIKKEAKSKDTLEIVTRALV